MVAGKPVLVIAEIAATRLYTVKVVVEETAPFSEDVAVRVTEPTPTIVIAPVEEPTVATPDASVLYTTAELATFAVVIDALIDMPEESV